ncbi:MAG: TIGR04283 family arsenosugar biosynthesis glycosyltransferase [Pyrinomonadaceae bacterium]|nr:TIGR04283 family arsenosugar biosynthesis glycosyltransferase [Pyrinomonadaceae bacterium]
MKIAVSIIIPTFNESETIKKTLESLKKFGETVEIIVVDGGSDDDTVSIVKDCDVTCIRTVRGRGTQMHAGTFEAKGDVLWFVHADTIPTPETLFQMIKALRNPEIVGGNFTICFDGDKLAARFLTWLYPNLRKIGLYYGDSAIFIRRETYEKIGGFKTFPLFEDLDLVVRMNQIGKTVNLPAKVTTSSRRFENQNFIATFARWSILQCFYWLGVNPYLLNKLYPPIRSRKKAN